LPSRHRDWEANYETLMNSRLFDHEYYSRFTGAPMSRHEAVTHYLAGSFGWGLDPHPLFQGSWYLSHYRDVAALGIPPLLHYLDTGYEEGRWPNPLFDTGWYRTNSPDLVEAGLNPLAHYIEHGWRECRQPTPLFDVAWYRGQYPYIEEAGFDPLTHYLHWGGFDVHRPNPMFDSGRYLLMYPDVAERGINPLVHYMWTGWREGRSPSEDFDATWYQAMYRQMIPLGQDPLTHYTIHGRSSGLHPLFASVECVVYDLDLDPAVRGGEDLKSTSPVILHVRVPATTLVDDSRPDCETVRVLLDIESPSASDVRNLGVRRLPDGRTIEVALGDGWVVDLQWLREAALLDVECPPGDELEALSDLMAWLEGFSTRVPKHVRGTWRRSACDLSVETYAGAAQMSLSRESLVRYRQRYRERTHERMPRRVLLISHEASITGAPVYLEQVAITLRKQGIEPLVVSLRDDMESDVFRRVGLRSFRLADLDPSGCERPHATSDWLLTRAGEETLEGAIRAFDPELAIISTVVAADSFRIIAQHGFPVVSFVHEAFGFSEHRFNPLNRYESAIDNLLLGATQTVFGSSVAQSVWRNRLGNPTGMVMASARDGGSTEGRDPESRAQARAMLGLADSEFAFLSVATFESRKRLEDIAEAFMSRTDSGGRLYLVGSRDAEGEIESRVRAIVQGDPRVAVHWSTSHLEPWYAAADALVMASEEEVFPLVLQEAAGRRIPRICSRFEGWNGCVTEESAMTYEVGDVPGLARVMDEMEQSAERRDSIVEVAARVQVERFAAWESELINLIRGAYTAPSVTLLPARWT
jgi:glycosyltransferase involved in cell wall biosynthesis